MVSLVIVSHSRALADSLVELARQVSQQPVPIAVAAGIGPDRKELGTDALEISEAIQSVYSPSGVLVLMDLGSAVISAEMALDLLPEEMKPQVRLCPAPLVEGAIAACVQAGLGSDLNTVCSEAQGAVLPKTQQLSASSAPAPAQPPAEKAEAEGQTAQAVILTLRNQHGLHARPAARFVQTASAFDAEIKVSNQTNGKGPVSARSLNALATLGAGYGDQILVSASGPQAGQAVHALKDLVEANFGEQVAAPAPEQSTRPPESEAVPPPAGDPGVIRAVPVSEGVALGPFYRYQPPLPPIPAAKTDNPSLEWSRLQHALEATRESIRARTRQLKPALGEADAAIFEAHLLILQDPELLDEVRQRIYTRSENAASAWDHSIQKLAGVYRDLDDPYLRQRAVDVLDVGRQVLFALAGKTAGAPRDLAGPVVLFAQEITPTETTQLDMSQVLALVTVAGGPTSHSAILARALGIPAVSGVSPALERLEPGSLIGVDGFDGRLWVDPPPAVQAELQARRESWLAQRQRLLQAGRKTAMTRDGQRIEVAANVGSLLDAKLAVENGAEGIGLLRTEFLYLARSTPPSEAEQVESLRQIGEAIGDRPVIVRTLDVGGDKELPYIQLPAEANPFLGVRALRLSLQQPELFLVQLRAILRAGADHDFKIMFPMVANLDEVLQARAWVERAHQELEKDRIPHRWPVDVGIMVEIPSAALLSQAIAPHVDFFSIGTNDLTQYTLAAERGSPALAHLQDAFHPSVLRLIQFVCQAASQQGIWAGVCGEMAGDPLAVPALVGLGVKELSLNPAGIPRVKEVLRSFDLQDAQRLAGELLAIDSAAAARRLAQEFLE